MHILVRNSHLMLLNTLSRKSLLVQGWERLSVNIVESSKDFFIFVWVREPNRKRFVVFFLFHMRMQSRCWKCVVEWLPHAFHQIFVLANQRILDLLSYPRVQSWHNPPQFWLHQSRKLQKKLSVYSLALSIQVRSLKSGGRNGQLRNSAYHKRLEINSINSDRLHLIHPTKKLKF